MLTLFFRLREAEADTIAIDEKAPEEARLAHRSLEALLKIQNLPASVKAAAMSARGALGKRLAVWDDLAVDSEPATEAEIDDDTFVPLSETIGPDGHPLVRIITPGWGSSGYYKREALEAAGKDRVFPKGTKMYWNHPTKTEERERPERDLRDLAATLSEDARWDAAGPEGPGLYAKCAVLPHYAPQVKALAPHIGLSIRGDGVGRIGEAEGRKGRIIEAIVKGKSIDFVTAPGAGGKVIDLFEAARPHASEEDEDMDLKEAQDALATERAEKALLVTKLAEANADRDRMRQGVILQEAAAFAGNLLKDTKLPDLTKARIVEAAQTKAQQGADGKLDTAALTTAVNEAVKSEAEYLQGILGKGRIRGMGDSAGSNDSATELEEARKDAIGSFVGLGLNEKTASLAVNGR